MNDITVDEKLSHQFYSVLHSDVKHYEDMADVGMWKKMERKQLLGLFRRNLDFVAFQFFLLANLEVWIK